MNKSTSVAARQSAAPFFAGWNETMIWSALQGRMGDLWLDEETSPTCALIVSGDIAFFAGDSGGAGADQLLHAMTEAYAGRELIMTAREEGWFERLRRIVGPEAEEYERYALRKEAEGFNPEQLNAFAQALPVGYRLVPIDGAWYHEVIKEKWSRDFCALFPSEEVFLREGLGYLALWDGKPVSGASSYIAYDGGIELQVETLPEHRRKGLARACSARLMLRCLEIGLYPSWDAANQASLALAQSLGYRLECAYPALEGMLPKAP